MPSDLRFMLPFLKRRLSFLVILAALPAFVAAQNESGVEKNHSLNQVQAPNQALSQTADPAPQDDPNDAPLGDIARNLRKKSPPPQDVIDDDNLTKVMEQAESRRAAGSALKFLLAGASKDSQVAAAPDATCSLSFNANAKSLLSSSYAQMQLPLSEMSKLEGPATIEGDALIVALYNRTDWHVSEVSVALTVVKKSPASLSEGASSNGGVTLLPAAAVNASQKSEGQPEKKPDVTVIYRMRAAAVPSATTVFSAPLNLELAPDEEWHWAIVQARGYPPQSYASSSSTARSSGTTALQPIVGQPISTQPMTIPPVGGSAPASKSAPAVPPSNPQ